MVCILTSSFIVSLVVEEDLESPNLCLLNGRIVGENLLLYFEIFLFGLPGYILSARLLDFVVVAVIIGFGVVVVVEVKESLY